MCKQHLLACQRLENAVKRRDSVTVLSGVPGAGKSTLIETCLAQVDEDVFIAHLDKPDPDRLTFLQDILMQFGFQRFDAKVSELRNMLDVFLRQQKLHRRTGLLIIEGAERASNEALEEVQHMVDVELRHQKALKVVLVGTPELVQRLAGSSLELAKNIQSQEIRVVPLTEKETGDYIEYRLLLAGADNPAKIFSADSYSVIYRYTAGVPGMINTLCTAALEHAFGRGAGKVSINDSLTAISNLELSPVAQAEDVPAEKVHAAVPSGEDEILSPKLVVTENGKVIAQYTLDKDRVLLGRDSHCDIRLNATFVSRYQSLIVIDPRGAVLIDLNSTNGTFVNSRRVLEQRLRDSDIITVGKQRLKFLSAQPKQKESAHEDDISLTHTQVIPALGSLEDGPGADEPTQKIKRVQ